MARRVILATKSLFWPKESFGFLLISSERKLPIQWSSVSAERRKMPFGRSLPQNSCCENFHLKVLIHLTKFKKMEVILTKFKQTSPRKAKISSYMIFMSPTIRHNFVRSGHSLNRT